MTAVLNAHVGAELVRPVSPEIAAFAAGWARIGGAATAAVLVREPADPDDLIDLHVLVDDLTLWPQSPVAALAGVWLPPNDHYLEFAIGGRTLRGKAAVMQPDQLRRLAGPGSLDTAIWTRLARPARLAWSRDATARDAAIASVARAVSTAALWAARLGPEEGTPAAYWDALFRAVRIARFGPKVGDDSGQSAGASPYAALLPMAWDSAGLAFEADGDLLRPAMTRADRLAALDAWYIRMHVSRSLAALRLAKVGFAFRGAADYAVWRIEQRTGVKVEATPWRRRHPLLAAPGVAWGLWRAGALRDLRKS